MSNTPQPYDAETTYDFTAPPVTTDPAAERLDAYLVTQAAKMTSMQQAITLAAAQKPVVVSAAGVRRVIVELEPDADEAIVPAIWQALLGHFSGITVSKAQAGEVPLALAPSTVKLIVVLCKEPPSDAEHDVMLRRLEQVLPGVAVAFRQFQAPVGTGGTHAA